MDTIESKFGIGCDIKKVSLAMIELDEDVVLDDNGETIDDWDIILGVAV